MAGLRDLARIGPITVFLSAGRSAKEIFWLRVLESETNSGRQRTCTTDVRRRILEWIQANNGTPSCFYIQLKRTFGLGHQACFRKYRKFLPTGKLTRFVR